MSGEGEESGETQPPTSAPETVQTPASAAVPQPPQRSGYGHGHHPIEFRFLDELKRRNVGRVVKLPNIRVIGRTSSFQFRGKSLDLRTIGTTLNVAYVLEGSVRRSADQVRVTAQLISTLDGAHRWSNTYDAKFDDV